MEWKVQSWLWDMDMVYSGAANIDTHIDYWGGEVGDGALMDFDGLNGRVGCDGALVLR